MAPSASLVIPFEADNARRIRALQSDVQQTVKQKGAFRNVTEESLTAQLHTTTTNGDGGESDASTDTELETIEATREKLFTAKGELTRLLQVSMNETNTLLDLVSWVLSGHSKGAQTTMSPALKGGVPVGSAELKTVPPPQTSRIGRQRLDDTSNIVRLQAFEKCSDRLLAASNRLKTESQHQAKYWDQMAKLRSEQWPISRLPRDSRQLVVHVGSAEAASRYRNKGLVPLRRAENGDLALPALQQPDRQRRLAVTIRRNGKTTGHFQYEKEEQTGTSGLGSALLRAQEICFEEELFSEASKEAQLIANMGAKVRSSSIEVDLTPQCSISITYLPQASPEMMGSQADDAIAKFIGTSLKTMLVAEHENRYKTRSQGPPPPMTVTPRAPPESVLIRPIAAQIRHSVNLCPIVGELEAYQKSFQRAGLPLSVAVDAAEEAESDVATLQSLRKIAKSRVKIALPSERTLHMGVETQLAPPRFGTQFHAAAYESECGSRSLSQTSSSKAAVLFLADILARDVSCAMMGFKYNNAEWRVRSRSPLELVLVEGTKPRAMLTSSCHSGSLAVSVLRVVDKVTEKMIYGGSSSTLVRGHGQREQSEMTLKETIDLWVVKALSFNE